MKKNTSQLNSELRTFLEKVVINVGTGRLSQQASFEDKLLPQITKDISAITGQKPHVRLSKKSIAGFKMREGAIVGVRVTLRAKKMVDFFERLVRIVLPRVRDFSGIQESAVDQGGVLNIGIREQYVFSEISPEISPLSFSFEAAIVPKHKNRQESLDKFRTFGVPFSKGNTAFRSSKNPRVRKSNTVCSPIS